MRPFRFSTAVLGSLLVLVSSAFAESPQPIFTGLPPLTPEDRAAIEAHLVSPKSIAAKQTNLPSRVVNHEYLPVVGQQIIGSCASWAATYYLKGYQEAREHGWAHPSDPALLRSPAMPYNLLSTDAGSGTSVSRVLDFLVAHGTCTWAEIPETADVTRYPTVENWKSAAHYRAQSWATFDGTTSEGRLAMKALLASGEPLVAVMPVTEPIEKYYGEGINSGSGIDNGVIFSVNGQLRAYHAVCIIGYDDDMEYFDGTATRHGAFLAVNSWGTWWGSTLPEVGTGGFMWLAYDLTYENPAVGDPYGTDYIYSMIDRIGYEPKRFATFNFSHPRRSELILDFYQGTSTHPDWTSTAFVRGGSTYFNGTVVTDVTDLVEALPISLGLRTTEIQMVGYFDVMVGEIRSFFVEDDQGRRIDCDQLPIFTEDINGYHFHDYLIASMLQDSGRSMAATIATSAAATDVDLDGDIDLVMNGELQLNDGQGNFSRERNLIRYTPVFNGEGAAWGDYNNDGLPDLAQACYDASSEVMEIAVLRNRGGGVFEELYQRIPSADYALNSLSWTDWNADGIADIAASRRLYIGSRAGGWHLLDVDLPERPDYSAAPVDINNDGLLDWGWYIRNANNTFTEWPLEGGSQLVSSSASAFGDYDSDGLPDLAITCKELGKTPTGVTTIVPTVRIYHNENGSFQLLQTGFTGVTEGPRIEWSDINNDGRPDIVYTGVLQSASAYRTDWIPRVRVLEQQPSGIFVECELPLPQLGQGPLCLFDADSDNDIDVFYAGSSIIDVDNPRNFPRAVLALSRLADTGYLDLPNRIPAAPIALPAQPDTVDGSILFRWNAATDSETAQNAIQYRLRVGNSSGGQDVISGIPPQNLGACRLANGSCGYRLYNLPAGRYYWSVQAIDGQKAPSPWSLEQVVELASSPNPVFADVNADGRIDGSDIIACYKSVPTPKDAADIDGDGNVTEKDAAALASHLVGGQGVLPDDVQIIGPKGGELVADGFRLTIPAGAFAANEVLRIRQGTESTIDTFQLPVVYTVIGMPASWSKPLDLWLRDTRTYYITPPLMAMGIEGFCHSIHKVERAYTFVEPDQIDEAEGWFLFRLQPPPATNKITAEEDWSFDFTVGVLGGYYAYNTDHFNITFPADATPSDIEALGRDLEDAYNRFKQPDLGFCYARRTNWPVRVAVRSGMGSTNGYQATDIRGINYGTLTFSYNILSNPTLRRATAGHEFFHLVQSFYDPRNRVSMAWYAPPHLWIDEAASPWAEELFVGTPGTYIPDVTENNMTAPFKHFGPSEGMSDGEITNYGYGSASVIRFLENSPTYGGNGTIRRIYENIRNGSTPIKAIDQATQFSSFLWLRPCYTGILTNNVYPFNAMNLSVALAPASSSFRIDSEDDVYKAFESKVAPLGSTSFRAYAVSGYAGLSSDDAYIVGLDGTRGIDLSLIKYNGSERPTFIDSQPTIDGRAWLRIDDAAHAFGSGVAYMSMVSSRNDDEEDDQPFRLAMGIAKIGRISFAPWTLHPEYSGPGASYVQFPTFYVSTADVDPGLYTESFREFFGPGGNVQIAVGTMWGPYPRTITVKVVAELTESVLNYDSVGGPVTLTASGPTAYRMRTMWTEDGVISEVQGSATPTGEFTIDVDGKLQMIGAQIDIFYGVTKTVGGSTPSQNTDQLWQPVFVFSLDCQ